MKMLNLGSIKNYTLPYSTNVNLGKVDPHTCTIRFLLLNNPIHTPALSNVKEYPPIISFSMVFMVYHTDNI